MDEGLWGPSDGSGPGSGLPFRMKGIPMQTGVLRVLRATAASWRRHKELRRTGQTLLAQRLERQTVLRDLGYLKQAASLPNAHVICGEGGTFLHLGWTTVSTFEPIERFPLAALPSHEGRPSSIFDPLKMSPPSRTCRAWRGTDRSTLTLAVLAGPSR